MTSRRLIVGGIIVAVAWSLQACSFGLPAATPAPPRVATQTPWVVYVPVTLTPEPITITPLPTVTVARASPSRTPTRASSVSTKAPVPTKAAVPTKSPTASAPVVVAPSVTPKPTCSAPAVTLLAPKDGASLATHQTGPGSDTFRFQWTPFQAWESDPLTGYRIDVESRKGNTRVNSDAAYVPHNWFITNGQLYIYDARRVYNLAAPAGGDSVVVTWKVTVIKTTGSFDNLGGMSGSSIECSPPSQTSTIQLRVE